MSGSSTTLFHLTARPFSSVDVTSADLLSRVEGEVAYWATQQVSNGSIPDPYTHLTYSGTASDFAYGGALLVSTGNLTYLNQTIDAMNWAANNYATTADDSTSDGLEFDITPLVNAYTLLKASGKVSASQLATWATDLNTTKTNPNQLNSNWSTYAMDGAWLQYKAGLISLASATNTIETLWTQYQSARENSSTGGLYVDGPSPPYSLSVEAVGRGNIVALLAAGYDGPSAAAMATASSEGSQASLLMQDPSGQAPTGGRTDDHLFVDADYQAIDQTLAATTANAALAAQYQTAADLTFTEMSRWENANGTFQVTKNQFSPSLEVGYQTASTFSAYNTSLMDSTATAYLEMTSKTVAQAPTPAQIGGYVYDTASGFDATFADAGGTAIEIETQGATSQSFGQYWNTLGIDRIGRVGWDTRLGPSDGASNGSNGVSFGPTWEVGGSWIHLAAEAGKYAGTVSTTLASPVLTMLTVVWAPTGGGSGPTFTQKLTITPDGMLSQTTESGGSDPFGMTLPLMQNDGATTMTQTIANGIASTSYPGGADAQNFIALNSGAVLSAETAMLSTYGDITPVRATSSGSEADVFVYPSSSGDPAAASVKSSFDLTATGYSSGLGWVSGTLYSGRTSAGGYGSSIALSGSGAPDAVFSKPVDFILQVSDGVITNVETSAAVTATIEGKSYSLAAYTPAAVSSAPAPPVAPGITLSAPGTVQEASPGAGVTVTETATTTGLSGSIDWGVLTASGAVESYFAPVALNADGVASFQVHLAHTGDTVVAVNAITGATADAFAAPVTITDPPPAPTIALSTPGTVQEASPGAGVTVTETATTTGLSGSIDWGVLTASGAVESYFAPVALNAEGVATFQVHLAHTGDYVVAVNAITGATTDAIGTPVTITDPTGSQSPPSIVLSAPGTVQEASPGAGVTITATATTTGLQGSIYWGVLTASGAVESYFTPVALAANGTASFQVHLANSGDTVVAVNSLTDATAGVVGAPVTITDPSSGPATVSVAEPATLIAGQDVFTGTVTNGDPTTVQFAWNNQPTGEYPDSGDMVTATKQANGTYTATVTVDHANEKGYLYVAVDGVVTNEWSAVPVASAPAPTLALSAPGSVQEASAGAGVTVTETITATGLTGAVYEEVLTASGAVETPFAPVALDNGVATSSVHLAASGDVIRVVNNTAAPTVTATSAPVTITDPSSGPATVSVAEPATLIAGQDVFTGTVTNGDPTTVQFAWNNQPTGEYPDSGDMVTATKQANGTYTATVTVDHANEKGYLYVAVDGVVTNEWSAVPLAAGSGSSASPSFIASAVAPGTSSATALLHSAALEAQAGSGSAASDMAAPAGGAAPAQAAPQPEPASYSAAALVALAAQAAAMLLPDHSAAKAA